MSTDATASTVTEDYFGVVLKSSTIPSLENGSRDWSIIDSIIASSGAKVIRYPGGTEAWSEFDFSNPAHVAELQAVIDYCGTRGLKLNFTVSLRQFFNDSTSTEDGVLEMTLEDKAALSKFIKTDLLDYAQEKSVTITQIQLDNEPLHRNKDGEFLNFREYSTLASVYALQIGKIIASHEQSPELIVITAGSEGTLNGSGFSSDAWGIRPIISGLIESGAIEYIDGVDLHWSDVTLHPEYEDILGLDSTIDEFSHRSLFEDLLWQKEKWRDNLLAMGAAKDSFSYNVSAWSLPQSSDGGGSLQNAGLSVMHLHSYSMAGISSATAYALIGADANALFSLGGRERPGGAIFGMLSDSIVGLKAAAFSESKIKTVTAENDFVVQGFSDDEKFVIYVINRADGQNTINLDLWNLIKDFGYFDGGIADISLEVLGLYSGFSFDDPYAKANIEEGDVSSPIHGGQQFNFSLDPFEIAELTISANIFSPYNSGLGSATSRLGDQGADTGRVFDNPTGFVNGSANGDVFNFDGGTANVFGGSGSDTLSFSNISSGINVSSREGVVSFDSGRVSYKDIEIIVGSQFDDRFYIDSKASFYGGGGKDVFYILSSTGQFIDGGADDDVFFIYADGSIDARVNGGEGNDTFFVGSNSVEITGGKGNDNVHISAKDASFIYSGGDGRDTISLQGESKLTLKFEGIDEDDLEFFVDASGTTIRMNDADEILFSGIQNLFDHVTLDFIL